MKKVLLLWLLSVGLSVNINAIEVSNSFWLKNNEKQINLNCDNGKKSHIFYFTEGSNYYSNGKRFNTLNSAAKHACKGKTKKRSKAVRLNKETLVCPSKEKIEKALRSDFFYDTAVFSGSFKPSEKDCLLLSNRPEVTIISEYKKGKLIDNYYKIKNSRNNIFYIRGSAIR